LRDISKHPILTGTSPTPTPAPHSSYSASSIPQLKPRNYVFTRTNVGLEGKLSIDFKSSKDN